MRFALVLLCVLDRCFVCAASFRIASWISVKTPLSFTILVVLISFFVVVGTWLLPLSASQPACLLPACLQPLLKSCVCACVNRKSQHKPRKNINRNELEKSWHARIIKRIGGFYRRNSLLPTGSFTPLRNRPPVWCAFGATRSGEILFLFLLSLLFSLFLPYTHPPRTPTDRACVCDKGDRVGAGGVSPPEDADSQRVSRWAVVVTVVVEGGGWSFWRRPAGGEGWFFTTV